MKVLVVGGTGQLGKAVSKELRRSGHLVRTADITDGADVHLNIRMPESTWKVVQAYSTDAIINCAGVNHYGKKTLSAAQDSFGVNMWGAFNLFEAFLIGRQGSGTFINIVSNSAIRPRRNSIWYCATKAGQQMITRQMARQYQGQHTIFGINFGMIRETKMVEGFDVPTTISLTIDEAAKTVVNLLEASIPAFNGSIFTIDGGETWS